MRIENEYDRAERHARAGVAGGVALALVALGFALVVRYRPEVARALIPVGGEIAVTQTAAARLEESAAIARPDSAATPPETTASTAPAPADSGPGGTSEAAARAFPTMFVLLQDTSSRSRARTRRGVITDVVLLPCSTANPRADGSILIPPHNPRHRTIVGLPQKAGDPPRGFVVPPHNPDEESQVPIQIIPIDSILAHTLRVPPHDPTTFNVVRTDSLSCLPDSGATQAPR